MMRAIAAVLALVLLFAPGAMHGDDPGPPHHMSKPDGTLDMDVCGACHNADLSLQRSKLETCTLCHAQTIHAGSNEHLRVDPARVKQALAGQPKGGPALPLSEDGHMYCGTCHLFHNPKVMEEQWLTQGSSHPNSGVAGAVRQGILERWAALAEQSGEKAPLGQFAPSGTRLLRLPATDGQLCRQCHGMLR